MSRFAIGKAVKHMISCMVSVLTVAFCTTAAAYDIALPNTSIKIPWGAFDSLVHKAHDTMMIPAEEKLPVAITFDHMQATATLFDSTAELALEGYYTVLQQKGWAEQRLFTADDGRAVSSLLVAAGDVVRLDDGGYVLTARTSGGTAPRRIKVAWMVPVAHNEGVSTLRTDLPPSLQCLLTISAPASFTDITVGNGFMQQRVRTGTRQRLTYLLGASDGTYEISWQPPVQTVAADTTDDTAALLPDTGSSEPVITVRQETALFLKKESKFAFTALHLSVVRAPVSRFTIQLPDSFVLLSLHGKGMQSSQLQKKGNIIACKLSFPLEGDYTLYCAGELPGDSVARVPAVTVKEATHQTGIFALDVEKGTEVQFIAAVNCDRISPNDFMNELSPGFADSLRQYEHSLGNCALAGRYFRMPFTAEVALQRHPPVAVADAICDAGSLRTVISTEGKMVTQATYSIRHRGRQFVALTLPDSANIWSVTLDGVPLSPSRENGRYTISLQRNFDANASDNQLILEVTYLQLSNIKKNSTPFRLDAPVPDMPISRLEWALFFPEAWRVKNVDGSFIVAQNSILGRHYLHLDNSEQQSLYGKLQETNASQQAVAANGQNVLALMPGSPHHLYGYMLLVTGEKPWIGVSFGSAAVDGAVKIGVAIVAVFLGIVICLYIRRRMVGAGKSIIT